MNIRYKKTTFTLFVLLIASLSAYNLTYVKAVTDATETLEISANSGKGFPMQAYSDEPMTVRWTCSKSIKAYIVEDTDYSAALAGTVTGPMASDEGATGEITATATEFAQYWAAFRNNNAETVTVEVTYNIGGFNWGLLAGILLIIGFVIVGVIAALKGYVFKDHGDGTVSWEKN